MNLHRISLFRRRSMFGGSTAEAAAEAAEAAEEAAERLYMLTYMGVNDDELYPDDYYSSPNSVRYAVSELNGYNGGGQGVPATPLPDRRTTQPMLEARARAREMEAFWARAESAREMDRDREMEMEMERDVEMDRDREMEMEMEMERDVEMEREMVSGPQFCQWNRRLGCHIRTDGIQRNHDDCEFDNGVCRTSDLQIQARAQLQRAEAAYNLENGIEEITYQV